MKKTALILGVLLIALVLACGCTTTSTSSSTVSVTGPTVIAVDGTFKVLEADESKNPTPFEVDLIAENRGNYDAKDVKTEIIFIYDNEVLLNDTTELGDIQAGKAKEVKYSCDITLPDTFDFDKLKLKVGKIYANGELLVDPQ
jgi:hypothetical protein